MVKSMFPHTVPRIVFIRLRGCPGFVFPVSLSGDFIVRIAWKVMKIHPMRLCLRIFSTVRSRGWLRAGFQELVGGPGPWIGRWTCRHGNVISLTVTEFPGGFNFTKGRKEVFFPVPKPIAGCIGKKRRKRKRRVPLPSGHLRSRPARSQCFCERDIFSMLTRFSSEPGCGTAAAGSWKRTSFLSCRNSPCTSWANHKSMVPWLRSFWTLQKYKSPWRPPSVRGILNKKQGKHSKYPWLKKHFGTRNQAEFPLRDL